MIAVGGHLSQCVGCGHKAVAVAGIGCCGFDGGAAADDGHAGVVTAEPVINLPLLIMITVSFCNEACIE